MVLRLTQWPTKVHSSPQGYRWIICMYKQRRFALNLYNLSAFYFKLDNIYCVKVFNGCPPAGLQHLIEVLFIPIWTYTPSQVLEPSCCYMRCINQPCYSSSSHNNNTMYIANYYDQGIWRIMQVCDTRHGCLACLLVGL